MSELFIKRPIFAMVISILIVILGWLTLQKTPIAQYPEIVPPSIQVTANYTGADALNIEQSVSTPIEQQVNGVEDMIYMKSINNNSGVSQITVSFNVGTDLDKANMLTQNRVSQANATLPPEVTKLGVVTQKSLAFPLIMFSLSSKDSNFDGKFLTNYAYINIVNDLARIKGVGRVVVFGGTEYAIRVWVKPDVLSRFGLTITDVMNAVKEQNEIVPGGTFGGNPSVSGNQFTYTARLQDRLITEEEFGNIVVKSNADGAQVRLKDVTRIEMGIQDYGTNSRTNSTPSSTIAIFQVPGSNALEVATSAQNKLKELSERFPAAVEYGVAMDTTESVTAGIDEIVHTLFEAVLLVIIVVFIFLQDWRATLIPLLTVPVSLIGTFIVFPLLGFSVNVLSLLGMVLAIGLVVDDAIVVVEAVMHHIEHGLNPKEATSKAMKEVGGPVVAIALILIAVFVPVALAGGITGRLYQQFAITIAISVAFSAFNALTLSPALASILLKPKSQKKGLLQKFFDAFNRAFDRFTEGYGKVAGYFARKLVITVVLLVGITVLAGGFGKLVPGGFVPEEDQGYIMMGVQLPDASSLERTDKVTAKVEKYLSTIPEIRSATSIIGLNVFTFNPSTNACTFFIQLKHWEEREKTAKQVVFMINRLMMSKVTEATILAFGPPPIPGLGTSGGFSMMIEDKGGNTPQYLAKQTAAFIEAASKRPEIANCYTMYRANVPQKYIFIDKDKVQKLGLRLSDVSKPISAYLGGAYVNNFNRFGRQYRTYVQSEAEYRMTPDDLKGYFIRDSKGQMIPMSTLASVKDTTGPDYTIRHNMYRAAEVNGNAAPGFSSTQALAALEEVAKETLPSDMGFDWSNMSYQEKESEGKGATMFLMALIFVFLILSAQYESWSLPFSVLLGTPWVIMGALMGLFLSSFFAQGYVNNVFAQIGLVMLIGLNAKNAILIVEFAKMKRDEGMPAIDAAIQGAKLRLRPILMTSFAFILGVVPLLTATGAGAEARKVMGMTVFSGMVVATILGVILIPGLYVFIDKIGGSKKKEVNP
ncbi:MAG: hydrophobe/amphiphile efflux-1 family RND transporter [Bacteroidetes bacterium B1(2017)]|nr:MAG: hydrophobe/amphiphile efflux-1 family RND transporter [Bacteroidetes bacterium B1(2017)]